jgi:hypothetical protein
MLLISSTNLEWAWTMIQRSFLVGGVMGMVNCMIAGIVIVYFLKRTSEPGAKLPAVDYGGSR